PDHRDRAVWPGHGRGDGLRDPRSGGGARRGLRVGGQRRDRLLHPGRAAVDRPHPRGAGSGPRPRPADSGRPLRLPANGLGLRGRLPAAGRPPAAEVGAMTRMSRPIVVLLGMMGRTPFAGVAWQVLHYLEGFRRLGCDVYYVEDTGDWPYDPEQNAITDDCRYTVNYIARLMDWCGLAGRWAYRAAARGDRVYGLSGC